MRSWFDGDRFEGFLLSPGDKSSCGGYILKSKEHYTLEGMEIVYEMDEYVCGVNGQKYKIKGGVPGGSWIERGKEIFRRIHFSSWYSDMNSEGRKVEPPSVSIKRLREETSLFRGRTNSLNFSENGFGHNRFLGSAGGSINLRKKTIVNDENEDIFSHRALNFRFRTRINNELYNHNLKMGHDMSQYETEIICSLAGSAHSRGTCPCHCRFIPHLNITYRYDDYILARYEAANRSQNSTPLAHTTKQISESRQSVEPGFCVVPELTTPKSYECELMVNPPSGVKELYHQLNPEKKKKAGSILIVADPEKQDAKQIKILETARNKIDKALEPLSNEEAKLLHDNKTAVDIFSSQLHSDALGTSGDVMGYIKDIGGEYYSEINKILKDIEKLYQDAYSQNNGRISGEEFFGRRKILFNQLDAVLNRFSKSQLGLPQYETLKKTLGLSTRSITHKWDQTGVGAIEGYASYVEKSAKLMQLMKKIGYIGIGLDFAGYSENVYEACSKGREDACYKTAIVEYSKFGAKQAAGNLAGPIAGIAGRRACMWALGMLTEEIGGIGAGLCLVTGIASGIAGSKVAEGVGEDAGEKYSKEYGDVIYEKLFNK
ncbi:TPA: hypothetical protein ACV5ZF_001056 [Salmonella enterica]|uniref:hypothetical protein n=1 Tax=Salmonella enterica TaxID=28901 RepID=UPI0013DE7D7C|nr:hypothetical protein [Salmonella enterica]HCM1850773.1 hypothetical protein [Salmonella enterica subsp. salamae serovar 42:z29:-]EIR0277167.1 hypothetical protein [Salmonella enterica]EIS5386124.1 hypothetical protein [Salmonella enterica]EJF6099039.1 hypothetical protein [Salmonella enterica]EJJ0256916.1 hypothetical protein [Salmonella enterica]